MKLAAIDKNHNQILFFFSIFHFDGKCTDTLCTGYLVSGGEVGGGKEAATLPAPLLTPFPWLLFNLRDEVILNERATPASYNKDDSSDRVN